MDAPPHNVTKCIEETLAEVEPLMKAAFAQVGGIAPRGSALDQNGLSDGGDVVREYLHAGEAGLALEHLIYMVREPGLRLSQRAYDCIESAGIAMGMDAELWQRIRPAVGLDS